LSKTTKPILPDSLLQGNTSNSIMSSCLEQSKCTLYVLFMLLVNGVTITMLVIGAINTGKGRKNGCPSEPFIPWFLIIGGSIIMCGLFCREILKRFCECCNDCCDN
jgi:hypothetical protein